MLQTFRFLQQPTARLVSVIHQVPSRPSCLSDFDDLFQFRFANLSRRQLQPPPLADLLGLLQFLDLCISRRYEFRLLAFIVFTGPFSLLIVLVLPSVFKPPQRLANGILIALCLLVRGVVETRRWLLLKRNVRIVLPGEIS
jgi:hypothetical protein